MTGVDSRVDLYNINTLRPIKITKGIGSAIDDVKYKWCAYLAAFGIDQYGNPYQKANEIILPGRFFQRDLAGGLLKHHEDVTRNFNKSQLCGAGWIASPIPRSIDVETAFKIFEHMGAFNE